MVTRVKRWLHKATAPPTEPLPPLCPHVKGWGQWGLTEQYPDPPGLLYTRHCVECGIPQVKRVLWERDYGS